VLGTAGTHARHGEVGAVDPGDGPGAVATAAELLARLDGDDVAGGERGELLDRQPVLGGQGFLPKAVDATVLRRRRLCGRKRPGVTECSPPDEVMAAAGCSPTTSTSRTRRETRARTRAAR
jgi:hypothetical protein